MRCIKNQKKTNEKCVHVNNGLSLNISVHATLFASFSSLSDKGWSIC